MTEKKDKMSQEEKKEQKIKDGSGEEKNKDRKHQTKKEEAGKKEKNIPKDEKEPDTAEEKKETEEDEDLKTRYLRLMADFQNYKKRSEKQRGEVQAYANEKIVTQLLDVMDNFERALDRDPSGSEKFHEGMVMIFDQMKGVLKNSGVEEIEADGNEFDPTLHNAVMTEKTDRIKSGHVVQVMQKGYTLNGKVIRPSMVKVAE